jgi:enoyl-[acyl-carrier protein] reductase I
LSDISKLKNHTPKRRRFKYKTKAPARRLVSIDDVGAATAFLAHDAARLITGETLYIDGGYHIID